MIDFAIAHPRCCIFAPPGTGKTSAAIMLVDALRLLGEIHRDIPVLTIAPPRVAAETWSNEVNKWDNLRSIIQVIPIAGTATERQRILKLPTTRRHAAIYTISYELLPWLVGELGDQWPFRFCIADESHHLAGFRLGGPNAARAKAIGRVAHTLVDRWINFTGTPQSRDCSDLWGQMWFVDRGHRLGARTWGDFVNLYMMYTHPGQKRPVPRPNVFENEIKAKIADVCLSVEAPPAPEPHYTSYSICLPARARQIYDDMKRDMVAELHSGDKVVVFNEGSATGKCCQLADGGIYTGDEDSKQWHQEHSAKLDALEAIVEEHHEPLLVGYEYRGEVEMIKRVVPKAVLLTDKGALDAFKRGEIEVGLAHPKSLGEGLDGMQNHCRALARFGRNWSLSLDEQFLARIGPQRQKATHGEDRAVLVWDLVSDRTVDDVKVARHATRRDALDLLMEAYL